MSIFDFVMDNKKETDNELSKIFLTVDNGENILLYGPGGCGKTFSLLEIVKHLRRQEKNVCCTATTGVAAVNLNVPECQISGTTLHSWAGVGLAQEVSKKLLAKVFHDEQAKKRWLYTDVLIIDEVSMLGADFLDKLDFIGKNIRTQKDKAFGGLQIILSGDFLQLPPVQEEWSFKAFAWKELKLIPFILETPKRYDDEEYFQLLLRIRKGKPTADDLRILRARVRSYNKLQKMLQDSVSTNVIKPTILYSKKIDVESYNEKELEKLPAETVEYIADDNFISYNSKARYDYYIRKLDDAAPKAVPIKVGAQVMLKCNLDVGGGLVNGARGVILETEPKRVYVRFLNGKKMYIKKHTWTIEDKDGKASRSQIPFILAWAYTIHKGQGCTLDYAVCDLGPSVFACGQAYVALSRVRNKKGLFISEFYVSSIKTNKEALEISEELQEIANEYIPCEIKSREDEEFFDEDEVFDFPEFEEIKLSESDEE